MHCKARSLRVKAREKGERGDEITLSGFQINRSKRMECERKSEKKKQKSIEILNLIDCFDSIHSLIRSPFDGFSVGCYSTLRRRRKREEWGEIPFAGTINVHIYTRYRRTDGNERKKLVIWALCVYMHSSVAAAKDYFRVASCLVRNPPKIRHKKSKLNEKQ